MIETLDFVRFQVDGDQLEHEQKEAQKLKDESLVQSINIKISRLKKLRKEWKYLMYTLQSSLMFFKSRDEEGKIEETYLEEF